MTKDTILIVDDDIGVRNNLREFLKSLNIKRILEATNGQEAVDYVRANPDLTLILLDLKMPTKDGLAALEEIRMINPTVKIAILTAYPFYRQADREVIQKWGVFDFMVKPIDFAYLEKIVSIAIPPKHPTKH